MATASKSTWPTRPSRSSAAADTTGRNASRSVAHDAWHIKAASAVVDGEIVVPATDGTTDFSVLQNELKGRSTKIVMVAFDLLYLNGRDLRKLPLSRR
jgi:bifunctional non-homologous end joining protein LigD